MRQEIAVQVDGRTKGTFMAEAPLSEETATVMGMKFAGLQQCERVIYVPNKLVGFYVRASK